MRAILAVAAALSMVIVSTGHAQNRFRIGPTYSSISLEDLSGASHSFPSWGGTAALITGDESEIGLSVARYNDLSTDHGVRRLTLYGLDSYYYPVGTRSLVAPFALTALGLARVTEVDSLCLIVLSCTAHTSATSQLALAFGLGVRVNVGRAAAATVAGRFLEVPGSQIQASFLIPISGSLHGRAPFVGARFRRDTKKAGTVAVQIDLAPLRITSGCPSTGCDETAVLFAPAYEASVRPAWGRVYGEAGFLLAGVYSQGPDRGIAQGAQGGVGADFYSGDLMWNLNGRLLWLQRNSGENVFGVQVGASLSPRIGGAR
ncbi:MAG: hypothetical protein DMD67_02840 [Gemmatimonadetes bacterium]|nr:MAG: hypothetical protein DMD67_02840 [Gemmatimonadota bacterium]